jgi:tellurite resistance protein TerC
MDIVLGGHDPMLWIGFVAGIAFFLCLDLFLLHRQSHVPSMREALLETAAWIALALGFNVFIWIHMGSELGVEFLTGYLVEKSLSVDNLFVILLVFRSLRIQEAHRHRVLFWGVFGAVVMRAVLIVAGARLVHEYAWILYVFGGILVLSGIKLLFDREEDVDTSSHWAVRLLRIFLPVGSAFDGDRFTTREAGRFVATPMLVALVLVEATDLIFAVDSIPAVLAVTDDPYIAFTSNVLAVLGLRALFFVLAEAVGRLRYLKPGLAVVLWYIGVKMLMMKWVHIPSHYSLAVILGILTTAGVSSWYADRRAREKV